MTRKKSPNVYKSCPKMISPRATSFNEGPSSKGYSAVANLKMLYDHNVPVVTDMKIGFFRTLESSVVIIPT